MDKVRSLTPEEIGRRERLGKRLWNILSLPQEVLDEASEPIYSESDPRNPVYKHLDFIYSR